MVTGYDCYKAMTDLEQRRWMRNVIKHSQHRGLHIPASTLFAIKYHNFCDFIEMSFDWSSTKQGTEYWAAICEKYKLHDQLNPGPYYKTKPPKTF